MQKKGKAKDTAVLRTLINAQAQNFATKRLLKDLDAINRETIPTVGVTARPLEHDLFIWHANIRGPEGTPYEGGVFHLELQIPESYPHSPPTVTLFTELPHPNVFGQQVCLDLLQQRKKTDQDKQSGWSSAYSIQSVLLQLQAFLFEEVITKNKEEQLANVKKAVQTANLFKCSTKNCKHGGKLSLWPTFSKKETEIEAFINLKKDAEILEQHFICYHTKLPYRLMLQDNIEAETKIKQESCLGVLLNVTKVPRTGQIKSAQASLDYVSIKAFLNEGIKKDSMNQSYTHWIPLYFGKKDNKERVMHLLKRSISMIMTNNTRRFKPEQVLEVFPKITQSIVFGMMDQKTHPSIRSLRLLAQVHALWLLCMEEWPQLYEQLDSILKRFIEDEKYRNKDQTPNLGILFNLLYVSQNLTFDDLVSSYTAEQLDRQVFWLIREIPELGDEKLEGSISAAKRAEISFKQQSTSFQMGCFQYLYLSVAKKPFKTPKELLQRYEDNFCVMSTGQENAIQERVFEVLKTIVDYDSFYTFVGQPKKTLEELSILLKQAVKNSKAKKYHGTLEEMNQLPSTEVQLKEYEKKLPKLEDFFNIEKKKDKQEFVYKITLKQNTTEDQWKQAIQQRWEWVSDELYWNQNSSATEIAQLSNDRWMFGVGNVPTDRLYTQIIKKNNEFEVDNSAERVLPHHSWQQLYMKLDFENMLNQFDNCPDFGCLYDKIHIVKEHLIDLVFPMIVVKQVSSGYHFITAVVEQLTSLQNLTFTVTNVTNTNQFPKKAAKAIFKGLNNLGEVKNALQAICYHKIYFSGNPIELSECLFSPLNKFQDQLKSLHIENTQILEWANSAKLVGALITNFKNIQTLIFKDSIKTPLIAKEITDGLMRAKQLLYVDISQNPLISEKGLASIVYNLSFSPKLRYLNISKCGGVTATDLLESLYKLLRITGSLEVLDCSFISGLNLKLNKEFFVSLGENRTLHRLNLNNCGELSSANLDMLGKATAFNSKKGGQLTILNLRTNVSSYVNLKKLIESMQISNYDHECWFGDQNKANKMEGDDHKKIFYCQLQNLDVVQGNFASNFNLAQHKQQYKAKIHEFQNMLCKNKKLVSLNLSQKGLNHKDADLLSIVMIPKVPTDQIYVRVLNLAKNPLGKEGAKILSAILEQNKSIEVLDVSDNNFGVSGGKSLAIALRKNSTLKSLNLFDNMIGYDGAKEFGLTLKENTTLQLVDFGNNRIRNKGLLALGQGLSQNKQSALKTIGLRFNFLTEEGVLDFLKLTNVSEIFIKNNSINDYGLFVLKKQYDESKCQVKVDLFQKLQYIEEKRLERTVWIQPNFELKDLISFFNKNETGVIIDARLRKGLKYANRTVAQNIFNFIEFADPISLNRAMALASTGKAIANGKAFRIYKAGTGTFIYLKKSAKQKKAESSKTNFLVAGRGRGKGLAKFGRVAPVRGRPVRGKR